MMTVSVDKYTNCIDIWNQCNFENQNILLWNSDLGSIDQVILENLHNYTKVFIIGTGGFTQSNSVSHPVIHFFDSRINQEQKNLHTHLLMCEYTKSHYVNHGIKDQLISIEQKLHVKMFDALLGKRRPHRDFLYDTIQNSSLKDQFFLTYYQGKWQNWEPGHFEDEKQPFLYSGNMIDIQGHGKWIPSQIMPTKIYNQTIYSIVAETDWEGFSTPTEKVFKPILAKRLFVFFGNQHYLRDLKTLGFQTFGNIIDESYDSVADNQTRWAMAFDQVRWLCEQNPVEIYKKCNAVLEHNHARAMQEHAKDLVQTLKRVNLETT